MSDRETIADARRLYHHMAHGGRWNLGVDTERLSTYVAQMERDADELDTLRGDLAETERERDEARSNYQFMVDRAVNEKLDGYRNLGQRAATAENDLDTARQQLAAEKERAERAEAELADGAMRRAFDKIADYVCPGWEYPGQVVRAVIEEDEQ